MDDETKTLFERRIDHPIHLSISRMAWWDWTLVRYAQFFIGPVMLRVQHETPRPGVPDDVNRRIATIVIPGWLTATLTHPRRHRGS
jgi:hypothetical protein